MNKISLIVGETASLPREIIEKYNFILVPYVVDWRDRDGLSGDNLFQDMREAEKRGIKSVPKTSQPSPWTFRKFFRKALENSENVLCITLSSKLSGGYNSALQAKKMLEVKERDKVYIVDSLNVTAGEGLFDLRAQELIEQGKDIEEIIRELKDFASKVHLIGMIEDPKWLEAGGRISHPLAVLLRQMQKIGMRPLIGVKDGLVKSVALKMRAKNTPEALFKELMKETKNALSQGRKIRAAICHADKLDEAQELKKLIEEKLEKVEVMFLGLMDSVIGTHTGPGTIALAWYLN